MSAINGTVSEWDFLIGYPLDEALQILHEEDVSYELLFTAAPGKVSSEEDAFIIAVREVDEPDIVRGTTVSLILICASADWNVNG